jgi:hypothetical protein
VRECPSESGETSKLRMQHVVKIEFMMGVFFCFFCCVCIDDVQQGNWKELAL